MTIINIPAHEVEAAINAAELVATEILPDDIPVTLTNKQVLALIAGAKGYVPDETRVEELERAIQDAINTLKSA